MAEHYFDKSKYKLIDRKVNSEGCPLKIGQKYGMLESVSDPFYLQIINASYNKIIQFMTFKCDCGKLISKSVWFVNSGTTWHCGCMKNKLAAQKNRKGTLLKDGVKQCCQCKQFLKPKCFAKASKLPDKLKGECKNCEYRAKMMRELGVTFDTNKEYYCEICNIRLYLANEHKDRKSMLCADHDHKTGTFRGTLCDKCNRGLGYYDDTPGLLRKAAEYLEKHSAKEPSATN